MSEPELLYRVENNAAYFTINREAKRNSISPEVIRLCDEYLDRAENDGEVRAICITGAGDRAFCSGADLGGGMTEDARKGSDRFRRYADLLKKIARHSKPTVARINGYCLAGGTGFMLACDIVIAAERAKFGTPEVNVGLWPMMIGALIFRNAGRKKAMEMVLLGEKLTAAQALDMGMLTRVAPEEKLDEEVDRALRALVKKSPIAIKIGKQAFYEMDAMPFEQALDFLADKLADVASTEDAVEGIKAFIEKREPAFKGK